VKSGLNTNQLPRGCRRIAERVANLEEQILGEIAARNNGEIPLFQAALIQSACRHEQRVQLLYRWLRIKGESLEMSDKTQLLRDIGTATTARDKCLKDLGLQLPVESDNWASLMEKEHEAESERAGDIAGEIS
jgi:hypothetical protein